MFCINCGKELEDNAEYCAYCGTRVQRNTPKYETARSYCTNCGKQIDNEADICVYCGARVRRNGYKKDNSKTLGIVSLIFSFLSFVIIGAILGIVGTIKAVENKNVKNLKINICALSFCVFICVLTLFW